MTGTSQVFHGSCVSVLASNQRMNPREKEQEKEHNYNVTASITTYILRAMIVPEV